MEGLQIVQVYLTGVSLYQFTDCYYSTRSWLVKIITNLGAASQAHSDAGYLVWKEYNLRAESIVLFVVYFTKLAGVWLQL
jgi:hypothetical protein